MSRMIGFAFRFGAICGIALLVPHSLPYIQAQQAQAPQAQPGKPPAPAPPRAQAVPQKVEPPAVGAGEGIPLSFLVLDATKGDPIPGVSIELRSPMRVLNGKPIYWSYQLETDGSGKAAVPNVAASSYQLEVKKERRVLVNGRVPAISLRPKDKPATFVYRMFTASRVNRTVETHERSAIPNVRVELLREAWRAGMRVLETALNPVLSDDQGHYSFDGVLPGTYYLRARPDPTVIQAQLQESDRNKDPEQRHIAYVNTLYPATPFLESATALNVNDGVDQPRIRIEVQRDRYYPVHGHLEDVPPEQMKLSLQFFRGLSFDSRFPFIWNEPSDATILVDVKPDHTFTYEVGLPPGPYWADFFPADKVRGDADFRVIDRPLEDMRIELRPALRLSGKVVDEDGRTVPPMAATLATFAAPRTLYQRGFSVESGGDFETSGLTPAAYRLDLQGAAMVIRKIESDGRTYQGGNFELTRTGGETVITVSTKGAVLAGTVEMMRIAKDYPRGMVTALPDPAQPTDMVKRTRLDGTNTFKFEHMEPGTYRLCAWLEEGTEVNQVMGNPSYEKKIAPHCEAVSVKADEAKGANLKQFSALEIR